jgi:WD40 repeat protein
MFFDESAPMKAIFDLNAHVVPYGNQMGESPAVFCLAGSASSTVCAFGRLDGRVDVREVLSARTAVVTLDTDYDQGSSRLAVSPDGRYLATAGYYSGLQMWDWRTRSLVWSFPTLRQIQSVVFASDGSSLVVDTESIGTSFVSTTDGRIVDTIRTLKSASASQFAPLVFGCSGEGLKVIDRGSRKAILETKASSFGVLAACFTRGAVIVSETDGWIRAFSLDDGRELCSASGTRWSAFMKLAPVGETDRVIAWASVAGDTRRGELVELRLSDGVLSPLFLTHWQHAAPILNGNGWVFEDGTVHRL